MDAEKILAKFRQMHDDARRGKVSLEYRAIVQSLLKVFADAQNATMPAEHRRRIAPRVRRALQVDLEWRGGRARSVTFDIGLRGFSALLPSTPDDPRVRFTIKLPRGTASGTAILAGGQRRHRARRASFQFEQLDDPFAVEAYVIEELIDEHSPDTRRTSDDEWRVEVGGRARARAESSSGR